MKYNSTLLPDALSVEGIVTVLHYVYTKTPDADAGESHDFPEILYIHKGRHTQIVDGTEYTLSPGQMLIYSPGAFHTARERTGAEAFILSFRTAPGSIAPLCNKVISLTPSKRQIFLQIMEDGLSCFRKYNEEEKRQEKRGMTLKENADEVTLQRIKKQLEFFLADLCADLQTPDQRTEKQTREFEAVLDDLHRHLSEPLTLTKIADECNMSVSKLKLLFREKSGGGAIDYFIGMKIDRAKTLIREGEMNFTQIAETLGFRSLHYFSRLFKKTTGLSPSEFATTE